MTKREYEEATHRRELQDCGWDVRKRDSVAFNSGSETARHAVCKMLVAHYLKQEQGYRIDSEVEHNDRGEIDIVAYGLEDEPAFAVECETSPTEDVIEDKIERYVYNTPMRDVFVLNVTEMPSDIMDAYAWVESEL